MVWNAHRGRGRAFAFLLSTRRWGCPSTPGPIRTACCTCRTGLVNVTLPRTMPSPDGKPLPPPGTAERFRAFARDIAAGRRAWTAESAQFIADQFDQLAADWDTMHATGRDDPLRDALTRGGRTLPAPASRSAPAPGSSRDCWLPPSRA